MTTQQLQIILSGVLGDGGLYKNGRNFYFKCSCKHKEYIDFKSTFIPELLSEKWYRKSLNAGSYNDTPMHILRTKTSEELTAIKYMSLTEILDKLDDFGLAMWFFDDGSLHKTKFFYNLNTQSFSKSDNIVIKNWFKKKYNVKCTLAKDKSYYYLRINKLDGANVINNILRQYTLPCFVYKTSDPSNFKELPNTAKSIKVSLNGVEYKNIKTAAEAVGLKRDGLTRAFRLNKSEYRGYKLLRV